MFKHDAAIFAAEATRMEYRWRLRQRKPRRWHYRQVDLKSFDERPHATEPSIQVVARFYRVYNNRRRISNINMLIRKRLTGKRFVISKVLYESQAKQKSNNNFNRGSIADRWT